MPCFFSFNALFSLAAAFLSPKYQSRVPFLAQGSVRGRVRRPSPGKCFARVPADTWASEPYGKLCSSKPDSESGGVLGLVSSSPISIGEQCRDGGRDGGSLLDVCALPLVFVVPPRSLSLSISLELSNSLDLSRTRSLSLSLLTML
jgi:hypothetical protein